MAKKKPVTCTEEATTDEQKRVQTDIDADVKVLANSAAILLGLTVGDYVSSRMRMVLAEELPRLTNAAVKTALETCTQPKEGTGQ